MTAPQPMDPSAAQMLAVSELRALVIKAARGAGLAWGLAEEAGWAADWLARRGLPAADWALDCFQANKRASSLSCGVELADRLSGQGTWPGPQTLPDGMAAPGYLLPFLHRIALRHGTLAVVAPPGLVALIPGEGRVAFGPIWGNTTANWSVTPGTAFADATQNGTTRPVVSASVLKGLEDLALRTTVPPSDQSRRDAGSAAGDND